MKATTWLCPLLTLLCATNLVCTAQRGAYPLDYADTNLIQDDYFLEKRNKPSLSIVNPLDVLRQRLLLEIARRQMKENTRQVELNRAILKNVGKRVPGARRLQVAALLQQQWEREQEREQRERQREQEEELRLHNFYANQEQQQLMDYVPAAVLMFDYLQRPEAEMEMEEQLPAAFSEETNGGLAAGIQKLEDLQAAYDEGNKKKTLTTSVQKTNQNGNGNEILANDTSKNHLERSKVGTTQQSVGDDDTNEVNGNEIGSEQHTFSNRRNKNTTPGNTNPNGFQWRYLYQQAHKNHFSSKK